MKRLIAILIMFLIVISFVSCAETNSNTISTVSNTTTETTAETTTEAITYLEYSIENDLTTESGFNNFDANFVDPEYYPLTGKLCFHLEINDDNYRNSYYYVITRTVNSPGFDYLSMFEITSSSVTRFHEIDYIPGKEVVIVKSADKIYGTSILLQPVASLIVTDSMKTSRLSLSSYTLIENEVSDLDTTKTPYLDCSVTIEDPNRILDSLKVLVYYSRYDIILGEEIIPISSDMFNGDLIEIDNIIFENLSPDTTFKVIYYFSGNDGVEDFDEVQMGYRNMSTTDYMVGSYNPESYPGYWAAIHSINIGENTTRVDMHYINSEVLMYNDEYLTASLNVYDDNQQVVATFPLTDNITYLDIENQYLGNEYVLEIECDQTDSVLSIYHINFNLNNIISATYSNQILRVDYQESLAEIISIHITITEVGQTTPTIDYVIDPNTLSYGYTNINYPDGPNYYIDDYDFEAVITFIGFNGEETITVGYSKR